MLHLEILHHLLQLPIPNSWWVSLLRYSQFARTVPSAETTPFNYSTAAAKKTVSNKKKRGRKLFFSSHLCVVTQVWVDQCPSPECIRAPWSSRTHQRFPLQRPGPATQFPAGWEGPVCLWRPYQEQTRHPIMTFISGGRFQASICHNKWPPQLSRASKFSCQQHTQRSAGALWQQAAKKKKPS